MIGRLSDACLERRERKSHRRSRIDTRYLHASNWFSLNITTRACRYLYSSVALARLEIIQALVESCDFVRVIDNMSVNRPQV